MPDRSADAGEGAAGCALGSQIWSGNMPALAPNPSKIRMPAARTCGCARLSAEAPLPCRAADSSAKDNVPAVCSSSTSPMKRSSPPITATNKYVYPARIAAHVSSWMTQVKDVNDSTSKNTNAVIRSADSITPSTAPSVNSTKNLYLPRFSFSWAKYSGENSVVPTHMIAVITEYTARKPVTQKDRPLPERIPGMSRDRPEVVPEAAPAVLPAPGPGLMAPAPVPVPG